MTRTVLKESFREKILSDPELIGRIAKATNKDTASVKRWATITHNNLLLITVLDVLRSYLKLSKNEVLTETVEVEETNLQDSI
jgi:hypothetical protein